MSFSGGPLVVGSAPSRFAVYPLDGLERHLRQVAPAIVSAFTAAEGMDEFAAARAETMTALEYLVGGLLECIAYCRRTRQGLLIRW